MNPRTKYLPSHWQEWVTNHPNLKRGRLTPEFDNSVCLQFEDGGFVFFKHAFAVVDKEHKEIAVFTEHCGYHIFNLHSVEHYATLTHTKTIKTKEDLDGN